MKYIKAHWEESRGDKYDDWGNSTWYIELDDDEYPIRQLEIYSNGYRLKYYSENMKDKYGQLGDQPINEEDQWGEYISNKEFEEKWKIKGHNCI